uniref:Uncharacterized protein n=1 Tax=uncultured prokaryote TaxID=198431 RepID=A0A0H5Q5G6_9ZZZZ|nr:hypothetical protein [uncultured prokaryote]
MDHEEKLAAWMLCWSESIAWWLGREYTGHTLKKKAGKWLLVVRVKEGSVKQVAFYEGRTAPEAIAAFGLDIRHGTVDWKRDLY